MGTTWHGVIALSLAGLLSGSQNAASIPISGRVSGQDQHSSLGVRQELMLEVNRDQGQGRAVRILPDPMAPPDVTIDAPPVTEPPESVFELIRESDRDVARAFYKKYIDVKGLPVLASEEVADLALQRAFEIVTHMLAGRPDILASMAEQGMYLIIIGKNQVYTDMPEYRNHPNPEFQNERVRGTGGRPTSFGEENLLSLPIDRYDDESIAVHEFCHTIDSTLRRIDPGWRERRGAAYRNAREMGLYNNTYAIGNASEYWAESAQAYFDCNRVNNWNHGPIGHREQLKTYDPVGYELCRSVFNLSQEQDWRYYWLQELPMVSAPPATPMFSDIDPYYTKFTWAREFTVLGCGADNEALLHANETIRRMFAYRHDILKALIYDGVRLVVLGPEESLADLPEVRAQAGTGLVDPTLRFLNYTPELKLLVVDQSNVLADLDDMYEGDDQVIRVFADALYRVAGLRPVESDFRGSQQYELRVKRLDVQFDEAVKALYEHAMAAEKWRGTQAVTDRFAYWTAGVLAYFDAVGQEAAPLDARHPIRTREQLQAYDPGLFALVDETMAYAGKVDWRYRPWRD